MYSIYNHFIFIALLLMAGCHLNTVTRPESAAPVSSTLSQPVATHIFEIDPADAVVGEIQITHATAEDTLSDIARRFNLGFEELVRANPGVDPWLPGAGHEIVLPTQFILPDAPRVGLVINLVALRAFYYPEPEGNTRSKTAKQIVITHPIGIGKVGWVTPEGTTKIIAKKYQPTWTPPLSVRQEHAERGDRLPKVVPPGPDNPLGDHAMLLDWPGYLIHGTNKPYGVGMRSSHGCLRFYPEDIAQLFAKIPVGTAVRVVNQRFLYGWHDDSLYLQVLPVQEEHVATAQSPLATGQNLHAVLTNQLWQQAKQHNARLDRALIETLMQQATGIATPISKRLTVTQYLATARRVMNQLPRGATWSGHKTLRITEEEFESMRTGVTTESTR